MDKARAKPLIFPLLNKGWVHDRIFKIVPYKILENTPQQSCTPTRLT